MNIKRLVAFIESHDNRVVSYTNETITATTEQGRIVNGILIWETVEEIFPATLNAVKDWLGY